MLKEIKEHSFYEELLSDESIVIDLGACRGEFINEFNDNYKVKKAILVEASPKNFTFLNLKDNYVLYNNIISSSDGSTVKFLEDQNSPYNGTIIFSYFNGIEHDIKTISLKKIIEENNLEYIDILKIDIEGSEYDVLENLEEELFGKIKQITVEFHDFIDPLLKQRTEQIISKIESYGFKSMSKSIVYMHGSEHYDVLFYK